MINDFQEQQLNKLRSNKKYAYEEASIYTVLLDLVDNSTLEEVFMMLHNVATDLDKRKELEDMFKEAKKWKWY